jgi:hypothetical protein
LDPRAKLNPQSQNSSLDDDSSNSDLVLSIEIAVLSNFPRQRQGHPIEVSHDSDDQSEPAERSGCHGKAHLVESSDPPNNYADDQMDLTQVPPRHVQSHYIPSIDPSDESDVEQSAMSCVQSMPKRRELSKSLNNLKTYPTRWSQRCQKGRLPSNESSSSETESLSEEQDKWGPQVGEQEDNNDSNVANNVDLANDIVHQGEEQDVDVIEDPMDLDSLATGRLRDMVTAQGFPCLKLDCCQLLSICEAFDQMDTGNDTRSGRSFRNPNQPTPPSSTHDPDHDHEPSRMNPPNGSSQDLPHQSCQALH